MSQHAETKFAGSGGVELYAQSWTPAGDTHAVVPIVHGIGEHSGRYANLVEYLTSHDFTVFGFDHRGHGRSPGRRGHVARWSEYREDIAAFLRLARESAPGVPLFLFGHSLGALIVVEFTLHYPAGLAGLVASGIPMQPTGVAKPHLVAFARVMSRVWPSLSISMGLDAGALSRDEGVVQAYRDDRLVHPRASVRWGAETLAAIERVRSRAAEIRLPLLLLHGEADRINSVEGSRELLARVSSVDKTLQVYPGGSHEPHNDLCSPQAVSDVEMWLTRQLAGRAHRLMVPPT
ncbi:MAG: alpha/beta hydrolase [Gemmatimonadaceae bacterium]|nr:alpha/beta hydrolase [Gemmatimonadaceae bacterium]